MIRGNYIVLLIIICSFLSCNKKVQKNQSDFFFRIPEIELGITTSKRIGAEFYVMFSKMDSVCLSDSIDFIKYETSDMSEVNLILDPNNKTDIYIRKSDYLKDINSVKNNFHILNRSDFFSKFFYQDSIKKDSLILKYPYIFVAIATSTYGIYMKRYVENFTWIKEGDILGGW